MQIIPLNLDSVLLFLHNSKLAYWLINSFASGLVWEAPLTYKTIGTTGAKGGKSTKKENKEMSLGKMYCLGAKWEVNFEFYNLNKMCI